MEFVVNGIKFEFLGMKDGDTYRPLNEAEKDRIARAVAKAITSKPKSA